MCGGGGVFCFLFFVFLFLITYLAAWCARKDNYKHEYKKKEAENGKGRGASDGLFRVDAADVRREPSFFFS